MKNMLNKVAQIAALVMVVTAIAVVGHEVIATEVNGIVIEDAFARARPGSAKMGGAFLKITNTNDDDDMVLSVSADIAKRTELHTHLMKDGVMRMTKVDSILVPAGQSVMFKPGGYHVMMMGLTSEMAKGSHFTVTLSFKNAGDIEVMVPVMAAGAMGGMKHMKPMKHSN